MKKKESSPILVLKKHGKSFYFAGIFLGKKRLEEMSILYEFCRYIDDEIDEGELSNQKIATVKKIKQELSQLQSESHIVKQFIELAKRKDISIEATQDLIDGVLSDSSQVWIANKKELFEYCYKVAGTIGIMSCPILGTTDKNALRFAVDLGKAMQITNICRDIVEDSNKGRIYIPRNLSENDLRKTKNFENPLVILAVKELLMDAEKLYSNSENGLAYLPLKSKFAIFVALFLYREIGRKIIRQNFNFWSKRVYTTKFEKVKLTLQASFIFLFKSKLWIRKTYE